MGLWRESPLNLPFLFGLQKDGQHLNFCFRCIFVRPLPVRLSPPLSSIHRYIIYTLHSMMQCSDQRRVFKTPASGVRKIILSTNIAETSVTINDVVFVIDSGKVKEVSSCDLQ